MRTPRWTLLLWRLVEWTPVGRLALGELRTLLCVARWVLRRPAVPRGAEIVPAVRGRRALPLAMAVVCVVEAVAVHAVVPWPTVRLALDVLGVYAVVMVLGVVAAPTVYPHLVHDGQLVLRAGTRTSARVPLVAVDRVVHERAWQPTWPTFVDSVGVELGGAEVAFAGPDGTQLTLVTARRVPVRIRRHPWSPDEVRLCTRIRLAVDAPGELVRRLTDSPPPSPPAPPGAG